MVCVSEAVALEDVYFTIHHTQVRIRANLPVVFGAVSFGGLESKRDMVAVAV